jgi:hypothetical protein
MTDKQVSYEPIYNLDDTVYYCGHRYRHELLHDGKSLKGVIHARVKGHTDLWCVHFADAKPDNRDYLLPVKCITHTPPARANDKEAKRNGPDVQPRRKAPEQKTAKEPEEEQGE